MKTELKEAPERSVLISDRIDAGACDHAARPAGSPGFTSPQDLP